MRKQTRLAPEVYTALNGFLKLRWSHLSKGAYKHRKKLTLKRLRNETETRRRKFVADVSALYEANGLRI